MSDASAAFLKGWKPGPLMPRGHAGEEAQHGDDERQAPVARVAARHQRPGLPALQEGGGGGVAHAAASM